MHETVNVGAALSAELTANCRVASAVTAGVSRIVRSAV